MNSGREVPGLMCGRSVRSMISPHTGRSLSGARYTGEVVPKHRSRRAAPEVLRDIPIAYFAVGLSVAGGTPDATGKAEASMGSVRVLASPVDIGIFPGRLESDRLSSADQMIIRLIRAKAGDFRDREAVRAWARGLEAKIARA